MVSITQGTPASQAGLRAADPNTGQGGDMIVAIDGVPVGNFDDLNSYLVFQTSPGQKVQVTVLRNNREVSVAVTLAARP